MTVAQPGGLILRRNADGLVTVVETVTKRHVAGPVQLACAMQIAKDRGVTALWQQNVDKRGRPNGKLSRFFWA